MVEMIIDDYGREAIAAIAAAWRDGAGDAEALEAGTGVPVEQLYEEYFASFGIDPPTAVEPAPILPSNVDKPPQPPAPTPGAPGPSATPKGSTEPTNPPPASGGDLGWLAVVAVVAVGLAAGAFLAMRRRRPDSGAP